MVSLDEMEERLQLLLNHRLDLAVMETQLPTRVGNGPENRLCFSVSFTVRKKGFQRSIPVCQCASSPSMTDSKV